MPHFEVEFEMRFTGGRIIIDAENEAEAEAMVERGDTPGYSDMELAETCGQPEIDVIGVDRKDDLWAEPANEDGDLDDYQA